MVKFKMRVSLYADKCLKRERKKTSACVIFGWYGKEEKM